MGEEKKLLLLEEEEVRNEIYNGESKALSLCADAIDNDVDVGPRTCLMPDA